MRWIRKDKPIDRFEVKDAPDILVELLKLRGIATSEAATDFLNPSLEQLNDHWLLPDIQRAVKRIQEAFDSKQKIAIYGDYDADGVTATSLLWDFLYRQIGFDEVIPYIPSRFDEGYGLNRDAVNELKDQGVDLIITVDCGVKDKDLIKEYKGKIDFIVTDHHTLPDNQDFEHIVIHPKREGSKYPFGEICGAAVAWKFVCALSESLKTDFDPLNYLDLVSIGTVCDVMPLVDENRAIVRSGLERIEIAERPGLRALLDMNKLTKRPLAAYHIGFVLGPRINAAGRIGSALDAVRLLVTGSARQANQLAKSLDELNKQRQELTFDMLKQAEDMLGEVNVKQKLLFVYGENWSEGVVGLVAGRLTEKYHRPSICATISDGQATASARSISKFNITTALEQSEELLLRFGGHAQAAGFSFDVQNLDILKETLEKIASESIMEEDIEKELLIDLVVSLNDINFDLLEWLYKLEPYGFGNSSPVFEVDDLEVLSLNVVGRDGKHVKLRLQDKDLNRIEAIGFNLAEKLEGIKRGDRIDVVGNFEINEWNGSKKIQINLKDVKIVK